MLSGGDAACSDKGTADVLAIVVLRTLVLVVLSVLSSIDAADLALDLRLGLSSPSLVDVDLALVLDDLVLLGPSAPVAVVGAEDGERRERLVVVLGGESVDAVCVGCSGSAVSGEPDWFIDQSEGSWMDVCLRAWIRSKT